MNRVKIALTVLTIAISIGPILGVVIIHRDNLLGLVMPPSTSDSSPSMESLFGKLTSPGFSPIQPLGNPTFDATTGEFEYPFNLTNPLPESISLDALSADIVSSDGTKLGTISIPSAINIGSGQSAIVDITGQMNPDLLEQYKDQISQGNISLDNINITIGGVSLHVSDLSQFIGGGSGGSQFGSIQTPGNWP
jgi:hypothetical protein